MNPRKKPVAVKRTRAVWQEKKVFFHEKKNLNFFSMKILFLWFSSNCLVPTVHNVVSGALFSFIATLLEKSEDMMVRSGCQAEEEKHP